MSVILSIFGIGAASLFLAVAGGGNPIAIFLFIAFFAAALWVGSW